MLQKAMVCVGLCTALLAGCAGMEAGPTDEEIIESQLNTMKAGIEQQDIDVVVSTFSESFYHPQVADKEAARNMLQLGVESGYGSGAGMDWEDADIVITGNEASIYPVEVWSDAGVTSVEVMMAKEAEGWYVTTLNIDAL
mgnify:CR=1 FL=1